MTAAAAYWPSTGRLEAFAAFPKEPNLETRGLRDGVGGAYAEMYRREELLTLGQFTPDLTAFLDECLQRWGKPPVIVADRFAEDRLREVLAKAGFPLTGLKLRACGIPVELISKGEGTASREARRRLLHGTIDPVARIVAQELSAKLETDVTLDLSALHASDVQGRARAFSSLVSAGLPIAESASVTGLIGED